MALLTLFCLLIVPCVYTVVIQLMTTPTPEQIETLKRDWLDDPIFDLEDTEGFKSAYQELRAFRKAKIMQWNQINITQCPNCGWMKT